MFCSQHFHGSVSEVDIIYNGLHTNIDLLRKKDGELNIEDHGPHRCQYDDMWSVLLSMGY